jgi:hypothetical protein
MRDAFANQCYKHWPEAAFGGNAAGSSVTEVPALPKQIRKRHKRRGARLRCGTLESSHPHLRRGEVPKLEEVGASRFRPVSAG